MTRSDSAAQRLLYGVVLVLLHACARVPPRYDVATRVADLEAFSPRVTFVDVSVSPTGGHLATVTTDGARRWLSFIDMKSGELVAVINPGSGSMVGTVHWVSDDRVIFDVLEGRGSGAEPVPTGEFYTLTTDGQEGRIICGPRAWTNVRSDVSTLRQGLGKRCGAFLSLRPGSRRTILVEEIGADQYDEGWIQLRKLDVLSGSSFALAEQPPHFTTAVAADEQGEPRLASVEPEDGTRTWYFREPRRGWRPLAELAGARPQDRPLGFSDRTRTLTLLGRDAGESTLVALNVDTRDRRTLATTSSMEVSGGLLTEPTTGRVLAVSTSPDDSDWLILDPDSPMSQLLQGLRAEHNDQRVRLTSITDDERLAIAHVANGPDDPGRFLLVNTPLWRMDLLEGRPLAPPK